MPEDVFSDALPPLSNQAQSGHVQSGQTVPPGDLTAHALPTRSARRGAGTILLGLIVAFLLGAAGFAYAAWEGLIPLPNPATANRADPVPLAAPVPAARPAAPAAGAAPGPLASQQDQLEARVAALSARLDALTVQAQAASGNAGRAEALLVAFAARRALDRGAPLNALEDQLRLRFGDTQPHAVTTVIEAARQPVTLDQLVAGLDSLAPGLTQAPAQDGTWTRIRKELAGLFVIRREATASPAPQTVLGHARILLEAGRTEEAIAEVERLPGAAGAADWFTAARRYDDARRALDILEAAALIGNPAARAGATPAPAPAPAT
ncbi:hypothetical protein ACFOD9_05095 [Novosphingobium bradum]|uniref:Inner membrane protein n=1 Tax=Novosphingobium bradum TaxID=1737444 RepID=A0ABV7ITX4_9SPHN